MVQEVRRIMLTQDELFSAFEGYRRMTPDFLPAGKIIGCIPEDNAVRVTLKPTVPQQPNIDYIIKGVEATKPFIRFCVENNIMIPHDGQKSLYVKDGVASLYIVYNLDLDVPRCASSNANQPSLMPSDILKATAAVT